MAGPLDSAQGKAMAEHTPTPWHWQEWAPWQVTREEALPGEIVVATCHEDAHSGRSEAEAHANAEFIVRAANSHEALLAACKEAFSLLGSVMEPTPEEEDRVYEALEAAIAKTEGNG